MEEEPSSGTDGTERAEPADGIPPLPPELSTKEQEVRRLIDAGAGSPEELRMLAAKLEEQRTYEESLWRRDVRPALMQSKKKRMSLVDLRPTRSEESHGIALGLLLFAAVLVMLFIATATSFLWLLIPVVGVLVYAWVHGRSSSTVEKPTTTPPDAGG